jgi:hypothetical protein
MVFDRQWSDEQVDTCVDMWRDGYSAVEIANEIGKNQNNVRMFIYRNRKKYDLEKRHNGGWDNSRIRIPVSDFEKQWYGSVPLGHWTITKPWGTV